MHLKKTHIALVVLSVFVVSAVAVWAISFGSFVSKSTNTHTTGFNATSFADIDNNGTLDWVGESATGIVATLRDMAGTPIYLSHTHIAANSGCPGPSACNFYANAVGDLDADGDLDLITGGPNGSSGSPNNVYYFDNGTNKRYEFVGSAYTLSGNNVNAAFYGQAAAIVDFTNDGKKDALWIGAGPLVIGINSTTTADTITFSAINNLGASVITGPVSGNFGVGVGDFNQDGNKDFVVPNNSFVTSHYGGFYQLGLGNGNGTFTLSTPIANDQSDNRPLAVAVGDVNKDGKDDFVIDRANFATAGGQMILFTRNAGNTGFDQTTIVTSTNQYRGVVIADIDGDTWPDIVQQRGFGGPFDVYINNGSGGFPSSASLTVTASSINNYAIVDVTGDSLKDIVTAAPNSIGYYPQTADTTAPTITSVSSDKAAGSYTVGEVIDIDVTFSEAVTSTGNVTVTLETGTTDRTCTFTVSNATTGTCNYTVQAGDTSADLTTNSIAGTIKDAALNSMTNFTPTTNLAANEALVINTAAPTITNVSSDKANGSYTTGEVIDIDVTFSKAVTSTGNVTVTLETGTTDRTCTFTVSNATTGTCNYTVQAGDTSGDLTVNTIAGTIADQGSVAMTNFTPATNLAANKALVIDTTAPTITNVSSDKANGSYTTGEVIDIDVTFSEAVTSTGNVTVTLETGTTDRTCTFTVSNATTGTCNYTVQAGDVSDDLTVNSIAGTIKDAVLNSMTNFTPTTNLAANKALVINPPVSGGSSSVSSPNPDNLKVVLSVPNGGETWKAGSTQWIFWGSSGTAPRNVTLQLSTDGGSAYADIASGLNDSGSYQWTVPTVPTSKARVRVQFLSSGTVYSSDVSDSDFTIVDPTPPPTLTLVQQPSDKPGFILKPRDTFDATWTTEGTGAAKVRISLSVNAGKSFRPVATIDAAEKHYVWKVPIFASKKAVLKFEMLDANGKVLSTSQTPVFSFKTRTREQRIVIPGLGL